MLVQRCERRATIKPFYVLIIKSPSFLGNCIWILAVFLRVSQTLAVPSKMARVKTGRPKGQLDGWLDETLCL